MTARRIAAWVVVAIAVSAFLYALPLAAFLTGQSSWLVLLMPPVLAIGLAVIVWAFETLTDDQ